MFNTRYVMLVLGMLVEHYSTLLYLQTVPSAYQYPLQYPNTPYSVG